MNLDEAKTVLLRLAEEVNRGGDWMLSGILVSVAAAVNDGKLLALYDYLERFESARSTVDAPLRCDYRRPECVNNGVMVGGRWVCRNHLATARIADDFDPLATDPLLPQVAIREDPAASLAADDYADASSESAAEARGACPKCVSGASQPCGRGGRICSQCGATYGAD